MVAVAQLVEHWIVIPGVAGSSPVSHPMSFIGVSAYYVRQSLVTAAILRALVAQLDRASAFEAEGRRFESCRAYPTFFTA